MNRSRTSLFVSRTFLPVEHQRLMDQMSEIVRQIPNGALRQQKLGAAGIMLVQNREYQRLADLPGSRLYRYSTENVVESIDRALFTTAANKQVPVPLGDARFLGRGTAPFVHVAYPVNPTQFQAERDMLVGKLSAIGQVRGDWQLPFTPFLSVGTLDRQFKAPEILAAFQAIKPEFATLQEARARVSRSR